LRVEHIKENDMKKIFNIVILASLILVSCNKDFLDIIPESSVTTDILYKTDKDFQDAVTGCYTALRSAYSDMYIYGDVRSDDSWHALGNNVTMNAINNFSERSSESVYASTWRNYYLVIFRANTLLSKLEKLDASVVITNKNRHIAEAKFLRALAYFDLVNIFGDLPKVTGDITIEEAYKSGRVSASTIYSEVIIPDLLVAEGGLSAKYTGSDIGRATIGAAKSLLGKAYLYTKDFAKAEAKLQEVVTSNSYSLLTKYSDLFDYTKNEHHSEYIFDIEYISGGLGLGSHFTNSFLPKSTGAFADTYFNIKGGLGELNTPTMDLFNVFNPTDPRRNISCDTSSKFFGFFQIPTFTRKYITPVASLNDSPANWKVIRYADVLLMYAEALIENNKTTQALPYINMVRTRVGLTGYTGLTQSDAREKVYLERRFELAMEGHRWFDLVRTGRALTVMASTGMKAYNVVFPLPLREVQVINNPSVFPQNGGYD
jgi:starch-binding outer membrane protein, SusD/RagB family